MPRGNPTGIKKLDKLIGGVPPGVSLLVYGPSYAGKSTLGIQIATSLPGPVLLVCPEMSPPVLKTIALRSGADLAECERYTGELEDWPATASALGARVVLIDSVNKFRRPPGAIDQGIEWARAGERVSICLAHQSRRGKPLFRGEYYPDGVFRLVRSGDRRFLYVEKARWSGAEGRVELDR